MDKQRHPWIMLMFFSPLFAEILSGSTTLIELLNPFAFPMLLALYGCGALIIRELSVGRENRWVFIIFSGMAYVVLEEGIACMSFFNPNWQDLGLLSVYGRALGVNWYWALNLIIYHSIVSISIPIFLVENIYSDLSDRKWLSPRGFRRAFSVYILSIILFNLGFPYSPSLWHYLLAFFMVGVFILLAVKFPQPRIFYLKFRRKTVFFLGGLWMFLFFFGMFGLPVINVDIYLASAFVVGYNIFFALLYSSFDWNTDPKYRFDSGYAPFTIFIVLWILSYNIERIIVTIIFICLFFYLRRKTDVRDSNG